MNSLELTKEKEEFTPVKGDIILVYCEDTDEYYQAEFLMKVDQGYICYTQSYANVKLFPKAKRYVKKIEKFLWKVCYQGVWTLYTDYMSEKEAQEEFEHSEGYIKISSLEDILSTQVKS